MKNENMPTQADLPIEISDAAWQSMLLFLKGMPKVYVGNPEICRTFLSALVWMTKEGATWRGLPKVYRYWNSIYRRFGRWCDAGVFEKLHEHFHDAGEISALLIDSTIVGVHSSAAGAAKKPEGKAIKVSDAATEGLQRNSTLPLRFILTPGAHHDVRQAPALIAGYSPTYVIADTAYDSGPLRTQIHEQNGIAVIRPRRNRLEERPYDEAVYKLRKAIERFFID